jgi:hypothetical protein
MANSSYPPAYEQAIVIIEQIQRIGFPNTKNIAEIENLIAQLQMLSPNFKKATHLASVQQLSAVVKRIRDRLEKEGDIPVKLYTTLNAQLILFKENLIT